AVAALDKKARTHPLSGKRICLIDDDETVRKATAGLLERWGCIVETASHWSDIKGECDAILADMQLGDDMNGLDTVAAIRNRLGKIVPAVILTGHSDVETREKIAAANLPALSKPV